ncbi:MAG TPA: NADP-dependent oxidoreductase [Bryobacteraceae bacterium]|jgi:NADPH-dependent curcumin reductase CurA|nr:NADP-dependent oxidoreductase [Bryobacteraceae bacterium]
MNRQITLAARPSGLPTESDFRLVESDIPSPGPGEVLVRTLYLSIDPYMRGRMNDAKSYAAPVQIGQVMVGGTVSRVEKSNDPGFQPGDLVAANSGWQDYALAKPRELRKLDPMQAPITTALGVLGHIGLTAYFGLIDVCDPKPGETVVVSGAAGAVGSAAGQIAKILGCRVVGIAGSDAKIRYLLNELKFDAAFNYKTTADYRAALAEHCPKGVDVYFDNVGGPVTDAVLFNLNVHARVSICGQISQYNAAKPETGPRLLGLLILCRAKVQGFLVSDYAPRFGEGLRQLSAWFREGRLSYRETIAEGLENAPRAFIGMLEGANLGKQLVKIAM